MMNRHFFLGLLAAALVILPGMGCLQAWEPAITVAQEDGIKYHKPVVNVGPDGMLYIAYKYRNAGAGLTEIHLKTYDGQTLGVLGDVNVSQSPAWTSYEHDLEVTADGNVHLAWMEYPAGGGQQHFIRYRFWNGSEWSQTFTLGEFSAHDVEDVRLAVSPNGNAHVVFMTWPDAACRMASLYPEGAVMQNLPLGGRAKHPDVAADDDHVHVVWQYRPGGILYTIMYARLENRHGGSWISNQAMVGSHDAGRPRMVMDETGRLHIIYNEEHHTGVSRKLWYFSGSTAAGFDRGIALMGNYYGLFHYHDLAVANGSVITSIQEGPSAGGGRIFYDWKGVGASAFGGQTEVPYTSGPKLQSVALSPDGSNAYVAYMTYESAISLITSGPVVLAPRGRVDVDLAEVKRTVIRTLFFEVVRHELSWSIDNQNDMATLNQIEIWRSVKDQGQFPC